MVFVYAIYMNHNSNERLPNTKLADVNKKALILPIFYNIPPLIGSSRGHAETLPAASLASAIHTHPTFSQDEPITHL